MLITGNATSNPGDIWCWKVNSNDDGVTGSARKKSVIEGYKRHDP